MKQASESTAFAAIEARWGGAGVWGAYDNPEARWQDILRYGIANGAAHRARGSLTSTKGRAALIKNGRMEWRV